MIHPARGILPLLLLVGLLPGCAQVEDPILVDPPEPVELSFSFEADLEGWEAVAIDTLDPPIDWRVQHTSDEAFEGAGSVELFLDNLNDQGKIWVEREVGLVSGVPYDVQVSYLLGTSDWGSVNLFTIITGVHNEPPRTPDDLSFQGNTGHDQGEAAGLVWLEKGYNFEVTPKGAGEVFVAIGMWGTSEFPRTYHLDNVRLRFTPSEG